MNTGDALLKAICTHRDDDTPRLVMADWYEENGQSERAQFVRRQVELARNPMGRSHAKLAVSRFGLASFAALVAAEPWTGLRPDHVHPMWVVVGKNRGGYARCICWYRGFPAVVACRERQWHQTEALWKYPIDLLCLTNRRGVWATYLQGEEWWYRSLVNRAVTPVRFDETKDRVAAAFPTVGRVWGTCGATVLDYYCSGKMTAAA